MAESNHLREEDIIDFSDEEPTGGGTQSSGRAASWEEIIAVAKEFEKIARLAQSATSIVKKGIDEVAASRRAIQQALQQGLQGLERGISVVEKGMQTVKTNNNIMMGNRACLLGMMASRLEEDGKTEAARELRREAEALEAACVELANLRGPTSQSPKIERFDPSTHFKNKTPVGFGDCRGTFFDFSSLEGKNTIITNQPSGGTQHFAPSLEEIAIVVETVKGMAANAAATQNVFREYKEVLQLPMDEATQRQTNLQIGYGFLLNAVGTRFKALSQADDPSSSLSSIEEQQYLWTLLQETIQEMKTDAAEAKRFQEKMMRHVAELDLRVIEGRELLCSVLASRLEAQGVNGIEAHIHDELAGMETIKNQLEATIQQHPTQQQQQQQQQQPPLPQQVKIVDTDMIKLQRGDKVDIIGGNYRGIYPYGIFLGEPVLFGGDYAVVSVHHYDRTYNKASLKELYIRKHDIQKQQLVPETVVPTENNRNTNNLQGDVESGLQCLEEVVQRLEDMENQMSDDSQNEN